MVGGTVSERPKVQLSKSCVGESPPWVQIPPVPLFESPEIPAILGLSHCLLGRFGHNLASHEVIEPDLLGLWSIRDGNSPRRIKRLSDAIEVLFEEVSIDIESHRG